MMPFDDAFLTVMNAQDVANIIQSFYEEGTGDYFKLAITDSRQQYPQELWVRPRQDQSPFFAHGQQVVPCETLDDQTVSIIVPINERRITRALVILNRRTS